MNVSIWSKGSFWLKLCSGSSTASLLLWAQAALAQMQPLPTDMPGYRQFWAQQTPAQRVQAARRRGQAALSSDQQLSLLVESYQALGQLRATPQTAPIQLSQATPLATLLTAQTQAAALIAPSEPWVKPAVALIAASDPGRLPQVLAATSPETSQPSGQIATPSDGPVTYAPELWQKFPVLRSETMAQAPALALSQPATTPIMDPVDRLLAKFPLLQPSASAASPSEPGASGPLDLEQKFPVLRAAPVPEPALDPTLLAQFPLFAPDPSLLATVATSQPDPPRRSQFRQQLNATVQTDIPLDPDELNVTGDRLSYLTDQRVGVAEGNARIRLSDGTTITGDKLLFYREERRLRSEGPFVILQPRPGRGARQIQGRNLDLDLLSRSAQFESSLVVTPGEAPGTMVYIRSEETTALLGDQIFFENATITTSPEAPITHYVKGDRVEVFPDDQVIIYDARVFGGGQQDEVTGDIRGGLQIAYFPIFIYSLRDHQYILPGQNDVEGVYLKSSWAYRFDRYNFGGLRIDAIQKKGLGLGFVHDYILPIPDTVNYGRAQAYVVTEADQRRLSSRLRVDHFFDFYAANLFSNEGRLNGQLNLNLDNTYRPAGGRNDNSDIRLNSTFTADLSTTTLNISRTGSASQSTYSLPITLAHNQRFGDARWVTADVRLDYNQRVSFAGGRDFADARFSLSTQARPPGWGGNYVFNYRAYSSSNGDRENRRNLDFMFTPDVIPLTRGITFNTSLSASQNQTPNPQNFQGGVLFFNKYELRSSLRFDPIKAGEWLTFIPGSVDYFQALYSTPNQESTVTLNPQLNLTPADWNTIQLRYNRTFNGNNSTPFQTIASNPRDTERISANFSFFTPVNRRPNVPPGFIAFEDDLPGEQPIALTFPDDTAEDLQLIAQKNQADLRAEVRSLLRFDTNTGFDFINQRWDPVTANFTWNTTPSLFNLQLNTSYDPNTGQVRPIQLTYTGRTSTTFDRDRRAGLNEYEPGFAYSLQAVYDPQRGFFPTYGVDLDATIGTRWQDRWRFRVGVTEAGIRRIEVRRDLRDFEVRLAYDPTSSILRLEGILVAFPSRPVGLTQQNGDFILTTPAGSFGSDRLLP